MATHTSTGGNYGRKFSISRENGQTANKGRPYFFEWMPQLPADPGKRKFETRTGKDGNPKYYELFAAIDGYLTAINREVITNYSTQKPEAWIVLYLTDGPEEYVVQVGQLDNQYATDFLKRILDANFDPAQRIRIAPAEGKSESGRVKLFLSCYSGPNKLEAKRESPHLAGIPQPEKREWKGETEYNWLPVAEWLYEQVRMKVIPNLRHDPISAPSATFTQQVEYHAPQPASNAVPVDFPTEEMQTDDLPF